MKTSKIQVGEVATMMGINEKEKLTNQDIILFSTADWDNPFWTNKQHMAKLLAEKGYRILYIESLGLRKPTIKKRDLGRIFRRIKKFFQGTKRVHPQIWVYSPLVIPFHSYRLVQKLNHFLLLFTLRYFQWKLNFTKPIIWTYNPLILDLISSLKKEKLVYHCVDDLSAAPHMPKEELIVAEEKLIKKADCIFSTSRTLDERSQKISPHKSFYFSNVADYDHFAKAQDVFGQDPENNFLIPADLAAIPRPRIGLVGAISDYKVDFELIHDLALANPSWHWVLIGQVGEGQPDTKIDFLKHPNIHLLGPKNYQDLPYYMKGLDVATLPCPLNDYTRSMFPMKFFEYMSAGKPIVATALPSILEFQEACYMAFSRDEFGQKIKEVLEEIAQGNFSKKSVCDQLAKRHTWEKRLENMLLCLENPLAYKENLLKISQRIEEENANKEGKKERKERINLGESAYANFTSHSPASFSALSNSSSSSPTPSSLSLSGPQNEAGRIIKH